MSEADLAKSIRSNTERVRQWESGQQRPTFRQAQRLAHSLRIPFGYLYLPQPPNEQLPLPDFRTLSTRSRAQISQDLLALVNSLKRKQEWYREFLDSQGARPRQFVGSASTSETPKAVAEAMRDALNLKAASRRSSSSWADYLRSIVTLAESAGILVLRSGIVGNNTRRKLDVEELRGLAVADELAPLVFINASDAKTAQIFTVAHELALLWLGSSGVSNLVATTERAEVDQETEVFCNSVAAEMLVPAAEFYTDWRETGDESDQLQRLARTYRVSTEVILRRAYDLGEIQRSKYFARLEGQRRQQVSPAPESPGGSFRRNLYARNSSLLVSAVFECVLNGRTLYREAAAILDTKPSTVSRLAADYPLAF